MPDDPAFEIQPHIITGPGGLRMELRASCETLEEFEKKLMPAVKKARLNLGTICAEDWEIDEEKAQAGDCGCSGGS